MTDREKSIEWIDQRISAQNKMIERFSKNSNAKPDFFDDARAHLNVLETIRAALQPSPVDAELREAVDYFKVHLSKCERYCTTSKPPVDKEDRYLETLIRAATTERTSQDDKEK
jgi:hypothetical protein